MPANEFQTRIDDAIITEMTNDAPNKESSMQSPLPEPASGVDEENMAILIQKHARGSLVRRTPLVVLAARSYEPQDEHRANIRACFRAIGHPFVVYVLYMLTGVLFFWLLEPDWTVVDSLYFTSMTMTTVGYGDLSPSSTGCRVFTLFMIFGGIIFVLPRLAFMLGSLTLPLSASGRRFLERLSPQTPVDLNGDGTIDYYKPRHAVLFYAKNLLPSVVLTVSVQLISSGIYVALEPEWDYFDGVYHSLVTATTVGYGDQTITNQKAKVWACVHMLVSVIFFGEILTTVSVLGEERAANARRIKELERELDKHLLMKSIKRAMSLRPRVQRDGEGLTELEFVVIMLLELGYVDEPAITPFVKQFRKLDVDGNGRIGLEDLKVLEENSASSLAELRKKQAMRSSFQLTSLSQSTKVDFKVSSN
eukprot:CAMPEP_0119313866 /NCGR_PEP_ID=MMETSP1333-20130426/30696_1 /TAXON_ID=418940 /ORGANISM="Scyphosphaera apsteinii, Strain RCC1455" /LENGTH=420 /DNA_ID=CAMNT_0007318837 /DNA_START=140 /DNA_END=1402 /DNA_ORIENTATION=-